MPKDKFVYVTEGGFTGLSHCFLSAHASTVCSWRMLGSHTSFGKKSKHYLLYLSTSSLLIFYLSFSLFWWVILILLGTNPVVIGLVSGLDCSMFTCNWKTRWISIFSCSYFFIPKEKHWFGVFRFMMNISITSTLQSNLGDLKP